VLGFFFSEDQVPPHIFCLRQHTPSREMKCLAMTKPMVRKDLHAGKSFLTFFSFFLMEKKVCFFVYLETKKKLSKSSKFDTPLRFIFRVTWGWFFCSRQ